MATGPLNFTISADAKRISAFIAQIEGLLNHEVFEKLPAELQRRLLQPGNGFGAGELCKLVSMPAARAGECRVEIQPGRLLEELMAALRALGFELNFDVFHEEPRCES